MESRELCEHFVDALLCGEVRENRRILEGKGAESW